MNKFKELHTEYSYGERIQKFQKLMHYKIRDILLVSSLYDSYLFEEDGRLYELLRKEYQGLNLNHSPEITHISSGAEAIEIAKEADHFDIIITTLHIDDMHVIKFAKQLREEGITIPIILLAYDNRERKELVSNFDTSIFERIFIWQGDYRLLIGIIKCIEDKMNVENDSKVVGVQSIILIEDNVKFYSSYLPIIYNELFQQSQRLLSEGVNLTHKFLRMRARPKILLCTNYEEAWGFYEKYSDSILGIISDINFKRNGVKDPISGIRFAQAVKERHADIPILLQSSNAELAEKARAVGVSFLQKGSPRLLHELREFMINNFGFGDFTFRTFDGGEVGKATNIKELEEQLKVVPAESIQYHAERNHFSIWLKARTEFWLAHRLRPRKVTDFVSVEDLRKELISSIQLYQSLRTRGITTDFAKDTFDEQNSFARIGGGSLGGKARGLGFINNLITNFNITNKFEGIDIYVPSAIVIGTDVFDQFMEDNQLIGFALNTDDDEILTKKFLSAKKFPKDIIHRLKDFLELVKVPLAVRSSSLLEDSQFQPFAGVYQTYMIPNNNTDPKIRIRELLNSIKRVYASTFYKAAKDYMKATSYRLEEEKMAVIIQKMVGSERKEGRHYPDFAGVAKSYNFYPVPPQKSSDGIALIALGLGKTVVEGGNTVRFCPKYPRHLLQFFSTKETIRNAQQDFYALNLNAFSKDCTAHPEDVYVQNYELQKSEEDLTLFTVGSTYSAENDSVYDGISRAGTRVVTFAPILKHKIFPLPEILDLLLDLGHWGMGAQIEIEFAVNLKTPPGVLKEFGLLQMRPMVLSSENEILIVDDLNQEDLIVQSTQVLGNGEIKDIYDIIVVDIEKFDRSKSRDVAYEVGSLNTKLLNQKRPYLLVGVGRWGSLDHWLGIPVTWDQISGAHAIVESGFKDFSVTPSQGSHFFQNLTSFRVGYFTVNSHLKEDFIDWDWLSNQPVIEELKFTKHLQFENPIIVKINGHQNKGVVLKPKAG
ncbi:MAG: histidine kinase [Ignavibacteriales bacterium]|nr:histidine kinase [Ignavibacteriales bacterium]